MDITQIHYVIKQLVVQFKITSKFHMEITGKRVGYYWVLSKVYCHKYTFSGNKLMAGIKILVKEMTSWDTFTLERIFNISRCLGDKLKLSHILDRGIGLNGEGNYVNNGNISKYERRGQNNKI